MSDSVGPHRRQPTRLPDPWDSPGKNTGVGCHFLLQCMKVKSESEVAHSCPTLSDAMDCSLPSSSVHGILQARVLEWVAIAFSKCWFNTWIYCKMITIIGLANTCIMSHNYSFFFFFLVRIYKIYSLSNFQVYNTVLLITTTVLCIRSSLILDPLYKIYFVVSGRLLSFPWSYEMWWCALVWVHFSPW